MFSYDNCIHGYSNCAAALTNLCHRNILVNDVRAKVTKVVVSFLRSNDLCTNFLILKSKNEAECLVAIDTTEIVVVGVGMTPLNL